MWVACRSSRHPERIFGGIFEGNYPSAEAERIIFAGVGIAMTACGGCGRLTFAITCDSTAVLDQLGAAPNAASALHP